MLSNNINTHMAYIGTYSENSEGIYACRFNASSGTLEIENTYSQLENPAYLTINKGLTHLYAVAETDSWDGKTGGAVGSFLINMRTGALRFLNSRPTGEKGPCHLCLDGMDKYLFTANYNDGSITMFPLSADGRIGNAVCAVKHKGTGPNPQRQEHPHAHFVCMTPEGKHLCAVDLGVDKLLLYDIQRQRNCLIPAEASEFATIPGSGPRHLEFSSDGSFAYIINELDSSILVMKYSSDPCNFTKIQHISTLPADYKGSSYCAAVHISADGRFLYASNRGHDSISIFEVDKSSGRLELISITPVNGKFPRDFAIDPTGRFLFSANQYSNTITVFSVNLDSGLLEPTGNILNIPSPVCIRFLTPQPDLL